MQDVDAEDVREEEAAGDEGPEDEVGAEAPREGGFGGERGEDVGVGDDGVGVQGGEVGVLGVGGGGFGGGHGWRWGGAVGWCGRVVR